MKIKPEILDILGNCHIEGNTLYLPEVQLERAVYVAVNKCLENIGGKWNRKSKGHVFDYDPADAFDSLLITGETEDMKKKFQFFPTPRKVSELVCDMAEIKADSEVLEPSIGRGDLADVVWERAPKSLFGVELNTEMEQYLTDKPYTSITGTSFLVFALEALEGKIKRIWNRVIMNPPFSRQQDVDHIQAAYEVLRPDGILVSVVGESPFLRTNKKSLDFRAFLDSVGAEIVELDPGDFKESGTMIKTRIIKIVK